MALEIERKFIVHKIKESDLTNPRSIYQNYIATNESTKVFVFSSDDKSTLSIKSTKNPKFNINFEMDISKSDADEMRKYLCTNQGEIITNYLNVVRVRLTDQDAFITIKGEKVGISCLEFEYSIDMNTAITLLGHTHTLYDIRKSRYTYEYKGHTFEVDVFEGPNEGLILAEVELDSPDTEIVDFPEGWELEETLENKYQNVMLAVRPYASW